MTSLRTPRALAAVVVVAGIGITSGCANTEEMDQLRQMASDAMSAAQQAQSAASRAQSTADGAATQAAEAMRRADEANACCKANTERMNRMFQKSMQK